MPDEGPTAADAHAPEPIERRARPPRTPQGTLNLALIAFIVVNLGYGLPMLLWPDVLWGSIAGASETGEIVLRSNRWAGAILTAWGIGAVFVFLRPRGQRTFLTTIALQASLAAAALAVSSVTGEFSDRVVGIDTWFYWLSTVIVAVLALYLWFARFKGREILGV